MNDRQMKMLQYLRKKKVASVEELCRFLSVSRSTARRDALELQELGAVKTGGGKIRAVESNSIMRHYKIRENEYVAEKERIAENAADFLKDGITLFMDGGTTTFKLCKIIKNYRDITVITNGIYVAAALAEVPTLSLFLAGGYGRQGLGTVHGEPTVEFLRQFKADVCFISADGVDIDGIYDASLQSAWASRQMLQNAAVRVLLCDHSKFRHNLKFRMCDFSQIDYIITDREPPKEVLKAAAAQKTEFIIG